MISKTLKLAVAALALSTTLNAQAAGWQPSGPIKMMIAFQAGGGTDTQGRLLAEELSERKGWTVLPENLPGKGGGTMAVALKAEPADGLSIGLTVSEALTYGPQVARNAGYDVGDFTMISTITGSQLAIFAKSDRGWKTLADVVAEAKKDGTKFTVGAMSPKLADATYVISKQLGIEFTTVMVKGGKGGLNGVVADDLDMGWGAGPQNKGVSSGDLVNLMSAEEEPLVVSPDAPMLSEFGVPFTFGTKFMVIAPAGIPDDAREALAQAISEIVQDPGSKLNAFISKAFSGPDVVNGQELDDAIASSYAASGALIKAAAE